LTTDIAWTDETWNPVVGCSVTSPGCKNCYAMKMAARLEAMGTPHYAGLTEKINGKAVWTGKVAQASEKTLTQPLRWKKPRMIFVNSMGDLFHPDVPYEWIAEVFGVMAVAGQPFHGKGDGHEISGSWQTSDGRDIPVRWPNLGHGPHVFQVLTKQSDRMRRTVNSISFREKAASAAYRFAHDRICAGGLARDIETGSNWPLKNVWLGVSAEDQKRADERIPALLDTPAAVRFVSVEPQLENIDLTAIHDARRCYQKTFDALEPDYVSQLNCASIDWVICGAESGPGRRPFNEDWARSLRDQCEAAGTPFFLKQMPAATPKGVIEIPILDGRRWIEFPRSGLSVQGTNETGSSK